MKNQEKASFFLSWLIYGFMTDLILKGTLSACLCSSNISLLGFRRTLGAEDLWDLEETDDAEYNYRQFREHFDADVKRWRYELMNAYVKLYIDLSLVTPVARKMRMCPSPPRAKRLLVF